MMAKLMYAALISVMLCSSRPAAAAAGPLQVTIDPFRIVEIIERWYKESKAPDKEAVGKISMRMTALATEKMAFAEALEERIALANSPNAAASARNLAMIEDHLSAARHFITEINKLMDEVEPGWAQRNADIYRELSRLMAQRKEAVTREAVLFVRGLHGPEPMDASTAETLATTYRAHARDLDGAVDRLAKLTSGTS